MWSLPLAKNLALSLRTASFACGESKSVSVEDFQQGHFLNSYPSFQARIGPAKLLADIRDDVRHGEPKVMPHGRTELDLEFKLVQQSDWNGG